MHKSYVDRITPGIIDDDFDKLADCDWIIEAVVERLDIKKALYQRLHDTISADCIVSSNTSTIPIRLLVEDMPTEFRQRFAITHYFNPVRYMRLDGVSPWRADTRDAVIHKAWPILMTAYSVKVSLALLGHTRFFRQQSWCICATSWH